MPLILFSGIPCSGKTTRATKLAAFLSEKCIDSIIHLVNVESLALKRNEAYKDSKAEKDTRASFKAFVERHLSPDVIVIVDSLNYIKGFRYEMYCRARAHRTPCCVIFCDTSLETALEWNSLREPDCRFEDDMLNELAMRFETPSERNRWDKPLFIVHPDDDTPCEEIRAHIQGIATKPPNLATIPSPVAETTFVYQLDKITQDIVSTVLEAQSSRAIGEWVSLPTATQKVQLKRKYSLAELRRLRRQFLKITQTHRPSIDDIGNIFVEYLQTNL